MSLEIYLGEYLAILLIMAAVLYVTNEVVRLIDSVRIMIVTRRVRKIVKLRSRREAPQASEATIAFAPESRQDTREWNAPSFQWKYVGYAAGGLVVVLLLVVVYGLATYVP